VFGTEFLTGAVMRFRDVPPQEGMPELPEQDKDLVMHVALPVLGGYLLMGSDAPESMGLKVTQGNGVYINLEPDSREETERLFKALTEGGTVEHELQDTFWGAYYGAGKDKFGVQWMFNYDKRKDEE
jgi:PhnB protein